jgi:hypothetical protein
MSVNVDVPIPDRYDWPTGSEEALTITCSRIARHISRAGTRVIGLLPVGGPLAAPLPLGPLLLRLATALVGFVAGDVALVDAWPTWARKGDGEGAGPEGKDAAATRFVELRPQILEIAPPACDDAASAAVALQNTLRVLRRGVGLVLVHLGGYAPPGTAPASLILVDGVMLLVAPRQTRKKAVAALFDHIPPAKRLGAVLIG